MQRPGDADDFVVLVRGTEAQAHQIKEQTAEFMREQMRLTLSPEKTHVTHVDDGFDLLGFRIVRAPWRGSKRVAYAFPSKRALREVMHRIKTLTSRSTLKTLDTGATLCDGILRVPLQPSGCGALPSEGNQGDESDA